MVDEEESASSRAAMLRALQSDVNDWPQRVKEAGVTNKAGSSYVPLPRNNEILRTPDDPEATYTYMLGEWSAPEDEWGSEGWYRILKQAGPELTWEWLMVDETKPYAPLFPDDLRQGVLRALKADSGYGEWKKRLNDEATAARDREERLERLREEMRSGKMPRVSFPELDNGR